MSEQIRPYGTWGSPLDTAAVFSRPGVPQWPERHAGTVYWLGSLPEEQGRVVLKRREDDGSQTTLTGAGLNIRTRVHEYGGRCHVIADGVIWFVNFADQRLYRQALDADSPAVAVTAADEWMLADCGIHSSGNWLIAVGERVRDGQENQNAVVAVDLRDESGAAPVTVLAEGSDFYACVALSDDGQKAAWVEWNHPNMPWDDSCLVEATFEVTDKLRVTNTAVVAGGAGQSVCQVQYAPDNSLVYALDGAAAGDAGAGDFWNLYTTRGAIAQSLTAIKAEVGAAHWVFGYRRYAVNSAGTVAAVATGVNGDELAIVRDGHWAKVPGTEDYATFSQFSPAIDDEVLLVADSATAGACVIALDLQSATVAALWSAQAVLEPEDIATGQAVTCATRDGASTHAWFYQPRCSGVTGPDHERPPLMVLVHGGPTGRSDAGFDPLRQFWTTRGFAVLDVNHRGSTGFGRAYRKALDGLWGVRDVDDVVDAVNALAEAGEIDPDRVLIRGGSAGGYAVLCALTRYPQVFRAGACYYGIGNLVTLARTTHKFESRYVDGLLGQPWAEALADDPSSVYNSRSPINHIDAVRSPMILFQGSEDRVVPPEVSREVVAALADAGITHEYVEYDGEGHGFRTASNRIDALEREAKFFADVLGFPPAARER